MYSSKCDQEKKQVKFHHKYKFENRSKFVCRTNKIIKIRICVHIHIDVSGYLAKK